MFRRLSGWLPCLLLLGLLLLAVSGCQPNHSPLVSPNIHAEPIEPTASSTVLAPPENEIPLTPVVEPTTFPIGEPTGQPPASDPIPWQIHIASPISADPALQELLDPRFQVVSESDQSAADLIIQLGVGEPLGALVYVIVAPFATLTDEISSAALNQAVLVADPMTTAAWRAHYPQLVAFEAEDVESYLWANPGTLAIVPFHELSPSLKVMQIDGQSPLQRGLDLDRYPLVQSIGISGRPEVVAEFKAIVPDLNNRDEERMTRITMTGVTALVRATAAQMEYAGILFPGEEVAPLLQMADIAHISNEVPFAADCPFPDAFSQSLVFCSRDPYFDLLTHLGADVIEVTGNHSNDYGPDSMVRSLEMYEAAGMQYYGGGRNLADAAAPAVFTDHGNRIAFVGCNPVGPVFAWATADRAGANPCNDYTTLESGIATLAAEGYVVIATMQYQEIYDYWPTAGQVRDFGRLADAGAAAVSGSQSHHPQGFAFRGRSYIHYGLGNLFFDQMDQLATRQLFIDTYVVYDNRLISVELWTGLIEFYARPRLMTAAEREALLRSAFAASGW